MNALRLGRPVMGALVAIGMLAGCGGAGTPSVPTAMAPGLAHHGTSSTGDLLYITTTSKIDIVSYSQHKLVATIPGNYGNSFICSDPNSGNVFVTVNPPELIEFAHGGTTPIATLSVPSEYTSLAGCSVDPTTDNLAVAATQSGFTHGAILVYAKGQGTATAYTDNNLREVSYPTYDNAGNVFADAYNKAIQFRFAELPVGKKQFIVIRPSENISFLRKIQWYNGYLNFLDFVGDHQPSVMYQEQVTGDTASVVGSEKIYHAGETDGFWIQRSSLYAFYGRVARHNSKAVAEWPYPSGGNPISKLYGVTTGANNGPIDITVSVAPSH